jgi:large subunit ribosomal protein L10
MPKPEKQAKVEQLAEQLSASAGYILCDYRGLNVKGITELRRALGRVEAGFHVIKNTLFRRAIKESGAGEQAVGLLRGPIAVTFLSEDPIGPAKELVGFLRTHDRPVVLGGLLRGRFLDPAMVRALATIPPREQLLAQLVGSLQAPLAGLVGSLQGIPLRLVLTLRAVAEQKQAA